MKKKKVVLQPIGKFDNLDHHHFIPQPPEHRTYVVGDSVIYGAHDRAIVSHVSDCKRFYCLQLHNSRLVHGKVVDSDTEQVADWTRILPIVEPVDTNFKDDTWSQLNYMQQDVSSLFTMVYSFGVNLNPEYQRGNVWGISDRIKLLDSIFAGRDIGKFLFNHLEYTTPTAYGYEIIDGKQRLTTLIMFYEDRFKYNGAYYSELSIRDRHAFKGHSIAVAQIKRATEKEILKAFLNLNIAGKPQDPNHIEYVKQLLEKINI